MHSASVIEERRQYRRVFSLVPEEDVVLFSMHNGSHFVGKLLDLSYGGALIYSNDPTLSVETGCSYKLYFQSRGRMFHLEWALVRRELQFFAFRFINVTPLDLAEVRAKLVRMEILAARLGYKDVV